MHTLIAMRTFVVDLVERVVWTYIEAFCGLLLISWAADAVGGQAANVADWSLVTKAALAAVPAAVAVIKNIAAGFLGNPDSAATVPRRVDRKGLQYAPVPVGGQLTYHTGVADDSTASPLADRPDDYVAVDDRAHANALRAHARSMAPRRRPRPLKG